VLRAYRRDAGIREPHGVHHSAIELRDPWRGRAVSWLEAHGLRDDAAESIELYDVVELLTVCCRSRGQEHWILEVDAAELSRESPIASHGCAVRRHCPEALARRW